jgi:hypothetical protein
VGDVIQFPGRKPDACCDFFPECSHVLAFGEESGWIAMTPDRCSGTMHVFTEVPGVCECGAERWTAEGRLEPGEGSAIGIRRAG